ncbi:MAG TPA: dTDP-glucose 4,6-dehydratase [bacterium]|nr:dTDP-glucose 4,6-dehydratase [bacterium]
MKNYLITGGCGFIGTNFIRHALTVKPDWSIINLDALTYAGNPTNLENLDFDIAKRYRFVQGDIRNAKLLDSLYAEYNFNGIIHFAAESHVDRSINRPEDFVETNILGTFRLLESCRKLKQGRGIPDGFRFLHISTDEVYGSLGSEGHFTEQTPYDPSSPYSASKSSADHFVKAYFRTYGLPTVVTNCSNNYGPYQFPEKLIPLIILHIVEEKPLPVYGDGKNIRDWLYVIDHCDALITVLEKGIPGETYNIGGGAERENIEIVHLLCDLMDDRLGHHDSNSSRRLIQFVTDRPGHDKRYAINATKIKTELGWSPGYSFEEALEFTVDWYLNNMEWIDSVRTGNYRNWIEQNYQHR